AGSDKILGCQPTRRSEAAATVCFGRKSFDITTPISVKPGYVAIHHTMSKLEVTLTAFVLPLVLLFASPSLASPNSATKKNQNRYGETGRLQKMIVEDAGVTMQLDLNGLNGSSSLVARPVTLHFAAAANSFFPILVFNDVLRGLAPGSIALALQGSSSAGVNAPNYSLPAAISASLKRLTVEKLPSVQRFDLAVRDSTTGFAFFIV